MIDAGDLMCVKVDAGDLWVSVLAAVRLGLRSTNLLTRTASFAARVGTSGSEVDHSTE